MARVAGNRRTLHKRRGKLKEKPGREKLLEFFVQHFSVMSVRSNGKIKNLTGGLFPGNSLTPRALDVSKSKKVQAARERSERDEQQIFFSIIRATEPKPRTTARKITKGARAGQLELVEHLLEPEFYDHPLFPLYRVRHFPNEGSRDALSAYKDGVRKGAFDIQLDCARQIGGKFYNGFRLEFKKYLAGEISPAQKLERLALDREGYFAHYVFEANEALILLAFYLGFSPLKFIGFPRNKRAFPLSFQPDKKHDLLCGCDLKVSELLKF
jgi:hypothetical protein